MWNIQKEVPERFPVLWLYLSLENLSHFWFVIKEDIGVFDVLVGEGDLFDWEEDKQDPGPEDEIEEEFVVFEADASVDPVAVVVHFENAFAALTTVVAPVRFDDAALAAESEVNFADLEKRAARQEKVLRILW